MNLPPVTSGTASFTVVPELSLSERQSAFLRSIVAIMTSPIQQRREQQLHVEKVPDLSKLTIHALFDKYTNTNGATDIAKAEKFFSGIADSGELNRNVLDKMREEYAHKLLTTQLQYDQYPELSMIIAKHKVSTSVQWKPCWDTARAHGMEKNSSAIHELCMAAVAGIAGERVRNGEETSVVRKEHQLYCLQTDVIYIYDNVALLELSNIVSHRN